MRHVEIGEWGRGSFAIRLFGWQLERYRTMDGGARWKFRRMATEAQSE